MIILLFNFVSVVLKIKCLIAILYVFLLNYLFVADLLQHWRELNVSSDMLYKYNHTVNIQFLVCSILSHTYHHFGSFALCSIYFMCSSVVWFLHSMCLHCVLCLSSFPSNTPSVCVFPPAFAPIFVQIHRAASVWKLSDLSKACSSTSPSHSAPNHLASHCRPSKTGEHPDE